MTFGLFLHVDYFLERTYIKKDPLPLHSLYLGMHYKSKLVSREIYSQTESQTYSAAGKLRTEASSEK